MGRTVSWEEYHRIIAIVGDPREAVFMHPRPHYSTGGTVVIQKPIVNCSGLSYEWKARLVAALLVNQPVFVLHLAHAIGRVTAAHLDEENVMVEVTVLDEEGFHVEEYPDLHILLGEAMTVKRLYFHKSASASSGTDEGVGADSVMVAKS